MACEVDDQTASLPPLLPGFSEVPIYCWVSRGSDRPNLGPHALMANTLTQSFLQRVSIALAMQSAVLAMIDSV